MRATPIKRSSETMTTNASATAAAGANDRRSFMALASAAIATGAMLPETALAQQSGAPAAATQPVPQALEFWPGGARLVVSISMQFEAGGATSQGLGQPFPEGGLASQNSSRLGSQHLVCLRIPRGHSAHVGIMRSP